MILDEFTSFTPILLDISGFNNFLIKSLAFTEKNLGNSIIPATIFL